METLHAFRVAAVLANRRVLSSPVVVSSKTLHQRDFPQLFGHQNLNTTMRTWCSQRENEGLSIRTVPVQVAYELLNAGHKYLDVRTMEEFAAGHIEGAINIPYMHKAAPGMIKNLNFLQDVEGRFGKDAEIVVGCQMGRRSQMAATELLAAGFSGITDMAGGYAAWLESGLPSKASA